MTAATNTVSALTSVLAELDQVRAGMVAAYDTQTIATADLSSQGRDFEYAISAAVHAAAAAVRAGVQLPAGVEFRGDATKRYESGTWQLIVDGRTWMERPHIAARLVDGATQEGQARAGVVAQRLRQAVPVRGREIDGWR